MQYTMPRFARLLFGALVLLQLPVAVLSHAADTNAATTAATAQKLTVYKNPLCFCCKRWMKHLHQAGIETEVVNTTHMSEVKGQWGVPEGMHSCHTAVWQQKYVFEGHVPARYIRQYLSNPPEGSFGLTVPGMPIGSPGMEQGEKFEPYNIYLLMRGGDYRFYKRVKQPESD